jgi:ParB family transcriptional regulator, chromosome partitioning protein
MRWDHGEARPLALEELGERYRRYRLSDPAAEDAMARSLRQYGQQTPVTVCVREGRLELLDGFKRRAAAVLLPWRTLSARLVEADEAQAKAAIYGLNCTGTRPQQLEEAWIVYALVREDGLTQVQAAELLGQHKSWVCRRLALLERLADEAKAELRLGLLAPSLARQLTRLPMGNQAALLTTVRREALTVVEARGVIDLLRGANAEQEQFILTKPREALLQAEGVQGPIRDWRLSPGGNRVARQLRYLLDALGGMANWLRYPGLAELKRGDRLLLTPRFERLSQDTRLVAALVDDLLEQLQLTDRRTTSHEREAAQRDRAALAGQDAAAADCPRTGRGPHDGAIGDSALRARAFGPDAGGATAHAVPATEFAG